MIPILLHGRNSGHDSEPGWFWRTYRYDTIDLLSAWSLERSAILLGCIADELGNAEVFPFERKMPEKFIGELDEYMCR